jgi:hypothetical protein
MEKNIQRGGKVGLKNKVFLFIFNFLLFAGWIALLLAPQPGTTIAIWLLIFYLIDY